MSQHFDAIIIGTGQAGPPLAERLVNAGMTVAIIERRSLAVPAYAADVARRGAEYGFAVNGDVRVI